MFKKTPTPCAHLDPDDRDWRTPYTDAEVAEMKEAFEEEPGPWTPRTLRLIYTVQARAAYADGLTKALRRFDTTCRVFEPPYPVQGCACIGCEATRALSLHEGRVEK